MGKERRTTKNVKSLTPSIVRKSVVHTQAIELYKRLLKTLKNIYAVAKDVLKHMRKYKSVVYDF